MLILLSHNKQRSQYTQNPKNKKKKTKNLKSTSQSLLCLTSARHWDVQNVLNEGVDRKGKTKLNQQYALYENFTHLFSNLYLTFLQLFCIIVKSTNLKN